MTRPTFAFLGAALASLAPACTDGGEDVRRPGGGGHGHFERVELAVAGSPAELLATWTDGAGWLDADGNPIAALPNPVLAGDPALAPLRAGEDPASIAVHYFDIDDEPVELRAIGEDAATGAATCGEFSARYYPLDDETGLVAWPNIAHPDRVEGASQFAARGAGDIVTIFGCDVVHVYPEAAGAVDIEFVLWHVSHADQATTPLAIEIEPAP